MRLTKSLFLAPFVAALVACGGGGGDSANSPSPTTGTSPPATSAGGGVSSPDVRSKIMAAAAAAETPAPGTTETLPVTSGGKIVLNEIQHFIGFNKTPSGKYFGLSDATGTKLVDPTTVASVCFNSFETGWAVNGRTSRACSPVDPETGYAPLPINATCNRALGTWSAILTDSSVLWVDNESERAWEIEGLPVIRHTAANDPLRGLIEYGAGGRQQAYATSAANAGKMDLTINFGSNCLGGFGLDDKLTNLMPVADTYFKFLWNSPKAGASGGHGWGLVPVGDRTPSVHEAYAVYDPTTGSYSVTFPGLACADRGNITVYKGTGPAEAVVWDPGTDAKGDTGFGIGWFAIQRDPNELQLWVAKDPVTFDRENYQIVLPGC